jgi:hypothetical protein
MKWCAARRVRPVRVQEEVCIVLSARCRARACAEQGRWWCVRAGTRTPVSASLGGVGRVQCVARAWPMGAFGGNGRLGELGGGVWGLVA